MKTHTMGIHGLHSENVLTRCKLSNLHIQKEIFQTVVCILNYTINLIFVMVENPPMCFSPFSPVDCTIVTRSV